ncbi:MAG: NADP(H)-dependent aldo-keto reductase [Bacteroidota bacterium]
MKYSRLGRTNLEVSKICLGTMTWGEQNTEAEGHEQMSYALDRGVNFWDTAELYSVPPKAETHGSTEKVIGTWFKKNGKRDKVILATKIGGASPNLTWLRGPEDFSRRAIFLALEKSLKRLQTDYVDLYQLHWPTRKANFFGVKEYKHSKSDQWQDNFLELLGAMDDLVKQGKIRYFGISNETPWGFHNFLKLSEQHNLPRVASVQNPYSLLNRTYEIGMAEMSIRENAGLLAYSPLGFGVLSGKYLKGTARPKSRLNLFGKIYPRYSGEQATKATKMYLDIAEKHGLSLAQMALAFVNIQPFLTANIIGATTMEQLKENIDSIDVELSDEILKEIGAVHNQISNPAP